MIADIQPPQPAPYSRTAAQIADGIRASLTYIEREPIAVYGRCLLTSTKPTKGETVRFAAALNRYAPYRSAAARLSLNLTAQRQLQDEIARSVAQSTQGV